MRTNLMPAELIIVDNSNDTFGAFCNWDDIQTAYNNGCFDIDETELAIRDSRVFHTAQLIAEAAYGGAYYKAGDRCYHVSDNFVDYAGRPQPADIETVDLATEIAEGNLAIR